MDGIVELFVSVLGEIRATIFSTSISERQKKAKELVEKVFVIAANLFFVAITVTFCLHFLIELGLINNLGDVRVAPLFILLLGFLMLLLVLLKLFQFVRAAELSKLYVFVEISHMTYVYLVSGSTPVPWVISSIKGLL